MANREVVVLSAVRSAVGGFGGSLKDMEPSDLGAVVIKEAIARAGVDPKAVSFASVGHCIPTDSRYAYVSRVATINAGMSMDSVAFQVSRLCGSAQQAIVSSAQAIMLGDADFAIGGGVEVMSRGTYLLPALRSGARMGDTKAIDSMVAVLTDPFGVGHMGITAENLADAFDISRERQDAFAAGSQRKAAAAIAAGRFREEIVPVSVPQGKKPPRVVTDDEQPRPETSEQQLAQLRPAFRPADGSVTAGNASSLNDGAAAVLLMRVDKARELGLPVLARIVSSAVAGVDPSVMGIGPVSACRQALQRAGWTLDEVDLIEANEAFAVQALAVGQLLEWDSEKVNVNGGAIALGHPIGASGCRILVSLVHEMQRRGASKGLATLCVGGGQGIAMTLQR